MADPENIIRLDDNLYNIVHGVNHYAHFLLGVLGIPSEITGRFRDCYFHRASTGELEIHIYTRNGGGNREEHADVTKELRAHPLFLRDFDDSFDSTYATYAFRVPPKLRAQFEDAVAKDTERALPRSHQERAEAFVRKLKDEPNDPEILRIVAAMQPAFAKLANQVDNASGGSEPIRELGRVAAVEDFTSNSVAPETLDELKKLLSSDPGRAINKIVSISRFRARQVEELKEEQRPSWFAGYMREFTLQVTRRAKDDLKGGS